MHISSTGDQGFARSSAGLSIDLFVIFNHWRVNIFHSLSLTKKVKTYFCMQFANGKVERLNEHVEGQLIFFLTVGVSFTDLLDLASRAMLKRCIINTNNRPRASNIQMSLKVQASRRS